jgi:hypothetical protein
MCGAHYNPSIPEAGELRVQGQSGLHSETLSQIPSPKKSKHTCIQHIR